jgi:hypothetical protein
MVKRQIILVICILLLGSSCKGQDNSLTGTKWFMEGQICYDSLFIGENGRYSQYYCETQNYVGGRYDFVKDTLILTAYQKVANIKYSLPPKLSADSSKVIPTYITKYIITSPNILRSIFFEDKITGYKQQLGNTGWEFSKIEEK